MKVTFFSGFLSESNLKVPVTRFNPFVAARASLIEVPFNSLAVFNAFSTTTAVSYPKASKIVGSLEYLALKSEINFCTAGSVSSGAN